MNWNQTAKQVYDFVRGLSPYPGAWTTLKNDEGKETVMKIFKTTKTSEPVEGRVGQLEVRNRKLYVACNDCWLQIDELQLAGKKRMDAQAFLNGIKDIKSLTNG